MCGSLLDIKNAIEAPLTPFNDDDADAYVTKVWTGVVNKEALDVTLYGQTVAYLMDGMIKGFGGLDTDFSYGTGLNDVARGLENNLWRFSAAKQYQQVRIMSKLAFTGLPFDEFKEVGKAIFKNFNENYLETEYVTAVLQSQQAREWVDFQENENIKLLRYHTQKDARVRDDHRSLDGITLPKDDKFWNSYMPSNGWRCRCFVEPLEGGQLTDVNLRNIPEWGSNEMPKEFKMNPGKDKIVFNSKHPYWSVDRGDSALRSDNFNLPLPR